MSEETVHLISEMLRLRAERKEFVVATVIASHGSTPQKPGAKMIVARREPIIGTIGGGAIEQQIVDAAFALLDDEGTATRLIETHLTHELGMCCGGRMTVFLEKYQPPAQLYCLGAGHVAKEVAALAHQVQFHVTIVDDRQQWANAERFPHATVLVMSPAEYAAEISSGSDTYVCIATHDHSIDQQCVEALLRKPLRYLGVIGSRRKAERFRMRLGAAGFSPEETARMESPMGVEIGAQTPEEIAVSIVARLVAVRNNAID